MKMVIRPILKISGWIFVQFFAFITFLYLARLGKLFSNLLFEQIAITATFSTLIVSFAFFKLTKSFSIGKSELDRIHQLLILVIAALLIFQLTQTTILNIDRSRSYYLLSWVDKGLVKISGDSYELSRIHSSEKLDPAGIQQRLSEQLSRGLIEIKGSDVTLTTSGSLIVGASNLLAYIFKLDGWRKNNY